VLVIVIFMYMQILYESIGANPTIATYNAADSLARFENIFFLLLKTLKPFYNAGEVSTYNYIHDLVPLVITRLHSFTHMIHTEQRVKQMHLFIISYLPPFSYTGGIRTRGP
jgi:hypothetical protein